MSSPPRVAQGIASILTCTVVNGSGTAIDYSATAPALIAEVWPGSTLAVTFSPAAAWNDAALGLVDVTFAIGDTATVLPGHYSLRIRAANSSVWLWQGDIEIVSSPSSTAVILPDLCTIPYAHAALSSQPFSDDEWQFLPYAIRSASDMTRKYCNRIFNRQIYTETLRPELDGSIRLKEIPINGVSRVAGNKASAVTISCSSANQQARAVFTTTGNRDEPGGITVTGLTLTRVASGVTTAASLPWATYPLVTNLVAAINALGGGWAATTTGGYGLWATTELVGGETAQGCLVGSGATLSIYSQDLSCTRTDYEAGFIWVDQLAGSFGTGFGNNLGRWGYPFGDDGQASSQSAVRTTYDAGFDAVPDSIQSACASLAKQFIVRFRQNPLFKSETAHQYKYEMVEMIQALSDADRQSLNLYRITNA